jgi:hypothetical protein
MLMHVEVIPGRGEGWHAHYPDRREFGWWVRR